MVSHANRVLSWQENLMREEMPPLWMWHLEHELAVWFQRVDRDREERYGGGRRRDRDDDGEQGPMIQNDLAASLRSA